MIIDGYSDRELAYLAFCGCRYAWDMLVKEIENVVYHAYHTMIKHGNQTDLDDLMMEAQISLHDAILRYNPDVCPTFIPFARHCVHTQMVRVANSINRKYKSEFSLDQPINGTDNLYYSDTVADPDTNPALLLEMSMLDCLDEEEKQVLKYRLQKYLNSEIAEMMGTNVKHIEYVNSKIKKALSKFRY